MTNEVNKPKGGRPSNREIKIKKKLANAKPMVKQRNLGLLEKTKLDGYVYRWFNDRDGRIQSAVAAGWEFVTNAGEMVENPESAEEIEKCNSKRVGTQKDGSALNAYLMAIEEEVYDYLQSQKQDHNDSIMEQIENRAPEGEGDEGVEVYLKSADISVEKGKSLKSM